MLKQHRRSIKRLAKRFNITLDDAILKFYNEQELNKNIIFSIKKKRNKGIKSKKKKTKNFKKSKKNKLPTRSSYLLLKQKNSCSRFTSVFDYTKDMQELFSILDKIKETNPDIFIYLDSENTDWTKTNNSLVIQLNSDKYKINFNNKKDIEDLAASFYYYVKDCRIVCWNLKDIISFFKFQSQINFNFGKIIYDLKVVFSYFGLVTNRPSSSKNAFYALEHLNKTKNWSVFDNFYKDFYYKLINEVVPSIETNPLVDTKIRNFVYSYYEVEGQANGRMKSLRVFKNYFMPHSMGFEEKDRIKLTSDNEYFIYLDYKHMEVSVLSWITKDENLNKMLNSEKDFYELIWEKLTNQQATEEQRKICKNIFLPVVFGQGSASLSKRLDINEKNAKKLIYSLEQSFPVAFAWVKSQAPDSNNFATDVFGRRRKFQNDELYKIRNFCIQSPSNMICLKKLVKLYEAIDKKAKICFHIHDGYCLSCKSKDYKSIIELCRNILEEDDDLFEGLKLKTSCHFGDNLNKLIEYK